MGVSLLQSNQLLQLPHTSQYLQTDFWEAQFENIHTLFHINLHDRREICSHLTERLLTNPLVLSFLCLWVYRLLSLPSALNLSVGSGSCVDQATVSSAQQLLSDKLFNAENSGECKVTSASMSAGTSGGHSAKLRKSDIQ